MRDQDDAVERRLQGVQLVDHLAPALAVEAAEALVDDHRLDAAAALPRVAADREREAHGDAEPLAAAQERDRDRVAARLVVEGHEVEGLRRPPPLALGLALELQPERAGREAVEHLVGERDDRRLGLLQQVALEAVAAEQLRQLAVEVLLPRRFERAALEVAALLAPRLQLVPERLGLAPPRVGRLERLARVGLVRVDLCDRASGLLRHALGVPLGRAEPLFEIAPRASSLVEPRAPLVGAREPRLLGPERVEPLRRKALDGETRLTRFGREPPDLLARVRVLVDHAVASPHLSAELLQLAAPHVELARLPLGLADVLGRRERLVAPPLGVDRRQMAGGLRKLFRLSRDLGARRLGVSHGLLVPLGEVRGLAGRALRRVGQLLSTSERRRRDPLGVARRGLSRRQLVLQPDALLFEMLGRERLAAVGTRRRPVDLLEASQPQLRLAAKRRGLGLPAVRVLCRARRCVEVARGCLGRGPRLADGRLERSGLVLGRTGSLLGRTR